MRYLSTLGSLLTTCHWATGALLVEKSQLNYSIQDLQSSANYSSLRSKVKSLETYVQTTQEVEYKYSHSSENGSSPNVPVMIVPGVAGSGLFVSYTNVSIPSCSSSPISAKSYRLWAAVSSLSPPKTHQHCWIDLVSPLWTLKYGPARQEWYTPVLASAFRFFTRSPLCFVYSKFFKIDVSQMEGCRTDVEEENIPERIIPISDLAKKVTDDSDGAGYYYSRPGVNISLDDPTGLRGVDYLDYVFGYGLPLAKYFHDVIADLKSRAHYVEGVDLAAFPYDWRLPLWQYDWDTFKNRIESLRQQSGRPVLIMAHSLGVLATNYFLNALTDADWKKTNIAGFLVISGALGGATRPVRAVISGYDPLDFSIFNWIDINLVPNDLMKQLCIAMGSIMTLMPDSRVFSNNKVLVTIENRTTGLQTNYTVSNWTKTLEPDHPLLDRIKGAYIRIQEHTLKDPGVPVFCLWSNYEFPQTDSRFHWYEGELDKEPTIYRTFGDNTLTIDALTFCRKWKSTIFAQEFLNLDHMLILRDEKVKKTISTIAKTFSSFFNQSNLSPSSDGDARLESLRDFLNRNWDIVYLQTTKGTDGYLTTEDDEYYPNEDYWDPDEERY